MFVVLRPNKVCSNHILMLKKKKHKILFKDGNTKFENVYFLNVYKEQG